MNFILPYLLAVNLFNQRVQVWPDSNSRGVKLTGLSGVTVDGSQGEQCDLVIVSLTRREGSRFMRVIGSGPGRLVSCWMWTSRSDEQG